MRPLIVLVLLVVLVIVFAYYVGKAVIRSVKKARAKWEIEHAYSKNFTRVQLVKYGHEPEVIAEIPKSVGNYDKLLYDAETEAYEAQAVKNVTKGV